MLLLSGCYDAPRDNPLDPALTPAVELLAVTVDSTSGSATLQWTPYEGKQPFAEYRVLRRVRGLVAADTVAEITDVHQTTFRDTTLRPDVEYGYWVEVVNQADFAVESGKREEVMKLVEGVREAGTYTVRWDGRDERGKELASGVYLYRLRAGEKEETRKLVVVR